MGKVQKHFSQHTQLKNEPIVVINKIWPLQFIRQLRSVSFTCKTVLKVIQMRNLNYSLLEQSQCSSRIYNLYRLLLSIICLTII